MPRSSSTSGSGLAGCTPRSARRRRVDERRADLARDPAADRARPWRLRERRHPLTREALAERTDPVEHRHDRPRSRGLAARAPIRPASRSTSPTPSRRPVSRREVDLLDQALDGVEAMPDRGASTSG
jgi:hypothetical protein